MELAGALANHLCVRAGGDLLGGEGGGGGREQKGGGVEGIDVTVAVDTTEPIDGTLKGQRKQGLTNSGSYPLTRPRPRMPAPTILQCY